VGFKLNPITGKLDLVGESSTTPLVIDESENTLLNVLSVSGDFTIDGDSSIRIKNVITTANNYIIQTVTINSDGELIIGSSSTLEVA
jgi:hypothetical protein